MSGTRTDMVGKISCVAADTCCAAAIDTDAASRTTALNGIPAFSVQQVNSGLNLGAIGTAATISTQYFCLNLISIIGSLCNEKYFPLFACTSAPIRVEIQIVPNFLSAICSNVATSTFALYDVEYVMNTIELSDSAMSIIQDSLQGNPLQFAVTDYKNFVWNNTLSASGAAASATTSLAMPIPAKYSSLKSILIAQLDSTYSGSATYFPLSSNKFYLQQYYFRIGATVIPAKYPSNPPEFFSECIKAVGSMSDINYQPSIDYSSYNGDLIVANNDTATYRSDKNSNSFYVGLDLENFPTSDRSHIFAGYNSNTDDIYFYPTYTLPPATQGNAAINVKFLAYAMFDSVLVFENNTAYVKF
jgi:hypothetical protein